MNEKNFGGFGLPPLKLEPEILTTENTGISNAAVEISPFRTGLQDTLLPSRVARYIEQAIEQRGKTPQQAFAEFADLVDAMIENTKTSQGFEPETQRQVEAKMKEIKTALGFAADRNMEGKMYELFSQLHEYLIAP
jgi:hypothetical protein